MALSVVRSNWQGFTFDYQFVLNFKTLRGLSFTPSSMTALNLFFSDGGKSPLDA